jgi:hypothetical protein
MYVCSYPNRPPGKSLRLWETDLSYCVLMQFIGLSENMDDRAYGDA